VCQRQSVEAVENRLTPFLPAEAVAVERNAESDGNLDAIEVSIRDPDRRRTQVVELADTDPLQELDRQALRLRVRSQRQPAARLHSCTVAARNTPPPPSTPTGLESERGHDLLIGAPARATGEQRLAVLALGHI
jgi:hypothetical protein